MSVLSVHTGEKPSRDGLAVVDRGGCYSAWKFTPSMGRRTAAVGASSTGAWGAGAER